jgi:DNA-3-methyladenine glycosylase
LSILRIKIVFNKKRFLITMTARLLNNFFNRDVLELAPDLLGKKLVRSINGEIFEYFITEVEAYRGPEDKACHASKGRTTRTEIMFMEGGHIYMYLIYGMYWMFNIVAGQTGIPQAALIRSIKDINGPGRLSKELKLDKSFYGESLITSNRIWLEDGIKVKEIKTGRRIGVDYSGEYWKNIEWRYFI